METRFTHSVSADASSTAAVPAGTPSMSMPKTPAPHGA